MTWGGGGGGEVKLVLLPVYSICHEHIAIFGKMHYFAYWISILAIPQVALNCQITKC